jgi:hypothetical protein
MIAPAWYNGNTSANAIASPGALFYNGVQAAVEERGLNDIDKGQSTRP